MACACLNDIGRDYLPITFIYANYCAIGLGFYKIDVKLVMDFVKQFLRFNKKKVEWSKQSIVRLIFEWNREILLV